jgi:gamma-glutamyltranspeptidase/glutathione hydrolase
VITPKTHGQYAGSNMQRYPYGASLFFREGKAWPVGEVLKQPDLGRTLRAIAAGGPRVLYGGELAAKVVDYFRQNGGILTVQDFAEYKALWKEPLTVSYLGYDVYSPPPGSGGMTILETLNTLEQFDVRALEHNSPEFIHLVVEALKLAFVDDDAHNTGKDYAKIPMDRLLSKKYAQEQAARIDRSRAQFYPPVRPGTNRQSDDTINHVVVDKDHNVVTMTQTAMHSMIAVPDTGLSFNQGMVYFSLDEDDINLIEGRQRPRFVMSASIAMRHGEPYFALGAGGGWTIPQTILQVLVRALALDMDAHEAVTAPRFVLNYLGNSIPYMPGTDLELEQGLSEATRAALAEKGHRLAEGGAGSGFGGLSAIKIYPSSGVLSGGADPRQEQKAASW